MTAKERVRRAIMFEEPDRVPLLFFNRDKERSDIVLIDIQDHFTGANRDLSEWGFVWERRDDTMGQPRETLLKDWGQLAGFRAPSVDAVRREREARQAMKAYSPEQYFLASLQLTGFTVMTFLRGFAETLEDLALESECAGALADIVFGFEEELIRVAAGCRFDGVAFYDDWGTQSGMLISPSLWRDFFKPRYRKQFRLAHDMGLDVYFHTCGNVLPIMRDFKEIGVDMLNLGQPNCYDIRELGRIQDDQCFVIPVSYQTTSLTGTREEIFREVEGLVACLGSKGGGLIGYIEEYSSIGMSDHNYQSCIDAFAQMGTYRSTGAPDVETDDAGAERKAKG